MVPQLPCGTYGVDVDVLVGVRVGVLVAVGVLVNVGTAVTGV